MVYQPECGISLMLLIKFGFSFMTLSEEMRKESDGFDAVSASTDLDSSSSSLVSGASYLQWNQNIFEYSRLGPMFINFGSFSRRYSLFRDLALTKFEMFSMPF